MRIIAGLGRGCVLYEGTSVCNFRSQRWHYQLVASLLAPPHLGRIGGLGFWTAWNGWVNWGGWANWGGWVGWDRWAVWGGWAGWRSWEGCICCCTIKCFCMTFICSTCTRDHKKCKVGSLSEDLRRRHCRIRGKCGSNRVRITSIPKPPYLQAHLFLLLSIMRDLHIPQVLHMLLLQLQLHMLLLYQFYRQLLTGGGGVLSEGGEVVWHLGCAQRRR